MPEFRILEEQSPRVETGPVRFGSDWAGYFIRGDDAMGMRSWLETLAKEIEDGENSDIHVDLRWAKHLREFSRRLGECRHA